MSDAPERHCPEEHWHERHWHDLDDTLADGPAPVDVPTEARDWLVEQRTMHGMLRAMHTADAAAREVRVETILTRIDAQDRSSQRRHWSMVAAAALVLASIGLWVALPPSLPTAEAAMARAVDEMAQDVDRRFRVQLSGAGRMRGKVGQQEFDLVTRPGKRFLIEGRFAFAGVRVAGGRIGCDGETVWVLPRKGTRRSAPISERERLLRGLSEILDLGYVDVHALVEKLPGGFHLRVVGRSKSEQGNEQLLIKARRRARGGWFKLRSADLVVDEASGIVTRVEADVRMIGGGLRHL